MEKIIRNIIYDEKHGERCMMDIYLPVGYDKDDIPLPFALLVHGGEWSKGEREQVEIIARYFLEHRVVCCSVTHRYSQEAKFPAQLDDIKLALKFIEKNKEKYNLNTKKWGIAGVDSGAHLGTLFALKTEWREEKLSYPAFIISYSGPMELAKLHNGSDSGGVCTRGLLRTTPQLDYEAYMEASPVSWVKKFAFYPEFLFIHGDEDDKIPIEQTSIMCGELDKKGIKYCVEIAFGTGHTITKEGKEGLELLGKNNISRLLKNYGFCG